MTSGGVVVKKAKLNRVARNLSISRKKTKKRRR
jgi:hypothetical protein